MVCTSTENDWLCANELALSDGAVKHFLIQVGTFFRIRVEVCTFNSDVKESTNLYQKVLTCTRKYQFVLN